MKFKFFLYSVITCNFNNYEILKEIENPNPNVEYIYVTDNENLTSKTWKIIIEKEKSFLDVKHNPYKYVSTNVCVWMDGSYKITKDFTKNLIIPFINSDKEIAISLHEDCSNVFQECVRWMYFRNMDVENGEALFHFLLTKPAYYFNTLFQTSFIISKKTDYVKKVYSLIDDFSHKFSVKGIYRDDQTIFSMVVSLLYFEKNETDKIDFLSFESVSNNEYFQWCYHNTDIPYDNVKQKNFNAFNNKVKLKKIE